MNQNITPNGSFLSLLSGSLRSSLPQNKSSNRKAAALALSGKRDSSPRIARALRFSERYYLFYLLQIEEHQHGFVLGGGSDELVEVVFLVESNGIPQGIDCQEPTSGRSMTEKPYLQECQDIAAKPTPLFVFTDSKSAYLQGGIRRSSFGIRNLSRQSIPYSCVGGISIDLIIEQTEISHHFSRQLIFNNVCDGQMLSLV